MYQGNELWNVGKGDYKSELLEHADIVGECRAIINIWVIATYGLTDTEDLSCKY